MATSSPWLSYLFIDTQLGLAILAFCEDRVFFLQFGTNSHALLDDLQSSYPHSTLVAAHGTQSDACRVWVQHLINHGTAESTFRTEQVGTSFQQTVWNFLCQIPPGAVYSYEDVAKGIGRPLAVRAVARACAQNSLAIAVPCHRVVRKNGDLGGYRWGIERKRWLLENEKRRGLLP
jgi:AraC family transcriptional regulator of adaptative response/methylated-DNA-[protein]-cysteine methyltransferase